MFPLAMQTYFYQIITSYFTIHFSELNIIEDFYLYIYVIL